jgi:hypothetical protein
VIPIGILAAQFDAPAPVAGGSYELIETTILGTAQSEVVFSSLGTYSSTYKHLQLRMTTRQSTNTDTLYVRVNADTGSNYRSHLLLGNGSSVSSFSETVNALFSYTCTASSGAANAFGGNVMDFLDAYSSTKNKTVKQLATNSRGQVSLTSAAWFNTSSITSLAISVAAGNFVIGSRFSLYGIKG